MKGYMFGQEYRINHMRISSSQKSYCQEVILCKSVCHMPSSAGKESSILTRRRQCKLLDVLLSILRKVVTLTTWAELRGVQINLFSFAWE
jgi:hypothetical protein